MSSTSRTQFGRDVIVAGTATAIKSLRNVLLLYIFSHDLSIPQYSQWRLIGLSVALTLPWVTLQLPGALVRFLAGKEDVEELREGVYSIFLFVGSVALLACALARSAKPLLSSFAGLAPYLLQYDLILIILFTSSLMNVAMAYLRAFRLMIRHSILTIGQNIGEVASIAAAVHMDAGLGGALFAVAAVRSLILLGASGIMVHRVGFSWPRFTHLKSYLSYSVPTVPDSILYQLFDAGDRFILRWRLGDRAVALYDSAYIAGGFLTSVTAPIQLVLFPVMAELWNKNQLKELGYYVTQSIRYITLVTLPALAAILVLAHPLLLVLVPEAYNDATRHFPFLALSFFVFGLGVIGGNLLGTAGKTRLLLVINLILAALNIGVNLILVPRLGISGAVVSTLVCHGLYTCLTFYHSRKIVHFAIPWSMLWRQFLGAGIMACALYATIEFADLHLAVLALEGVVVYLGVSLLLGTIGAREVDYMQRLIGRD